ncbi:MAG: phosphoribosylanthranilate isomerase [Vicinamibacterales bacterium]
MRPPRVKICGITRIEDADLAVSLGADAIGFIFWPRSPRAITRDRARAIAGALPPLVTRVGVFVDMPVDEVSDIIRSVGLDVAQLHGGEDVGEYKRLEVRLMKAITLETDASLQQGSELPAFVTPLVDALDLERRGGTGRRADWARARMLAAQRAVVLAGGLNAENIGEAVRAVRPWAVDVSSGVEHSPGIKSRDRMHAFFAELAAGMEDQ